MSEKIIDWSGCPLVEFNANIQSGAAVLRGTRLPVAAIVDNFDFGVSTDEIAEQFDVSLPQVEAIVDYANGYRIAHPA